MSENKRYWKKTWGELLISENFAHTENSLWDLDYGYNTHSSIQTSSYNVIGREVMLVAQEVLDE